MQISLKRYVKPLLLTALFIVVGFLIDDEFGVVGVAIGLFWLLVTVLFDVARSRNNTNRQVP